MTVVDAKAEAKSRLLFDGPDWSFETLDRIFASVRAIGEGELGLNPYRT